MQKIYILEEADAYKIVKLFQRKRDQEYFVLQVSNGGYADICQWSDKYQNVHLATVKTDRLDEANEMHITR